MCNINKTSLETCVRCFESFEPETMTWAEHRVTGVMAEGCKNGRWYLGKVTWDLENVVEIQIPINESLCPGCEEQRLKALDQHAEFCVSCIPTWFSAADCGESWDEV